MLREIIHRKVAEVERDKQEQGLAILQKKLQPGTFAFREALTRNAWGLIAECKLASPVKGPLCDRGIGELAQLYENGGAAALSVLTDKHFCGRLAHVAEAKAVSALPVLRKDFIIDEYQLYQARVAGADAVLLIAAVLNDEQLGRYLTVAEELGLDCLVEVHSREELARVQRTPARIIGINNRDLTTFTTNLSTTFALVPFCDFSRLIISESGIQTGSDVKKLQAAGIRGALVGEGLVTAGSILGKVRELSLNEVEEFTDAE